VPETVRPTAGAPPSRLVLWDVDGTLLRAGDVASAAFTRAVEAIVGRPVRHRVRMSGKTDPQIVGELLAEAGVPDPKRHVTAILARLQDELRGAGPVIAARGEVLPGIRELLPTLHADPRFLQTLLTGNLAPNARVKVGAFGLDRWLDLEVGAYGSDDADRRNLVPVALERVARRRGRRFEPGAVWVIGDSDNDLACARAAGARCLLVGTGRATREELLPLGADATLADLSDVAGVVALLAG
jgi:phosphoglycolate phosphatase